jgi:hypothetical protein
MAPKLCFKFLVFEIQFWKLSNDSLIIYYIKVLVCDGIKTL